MIELPASVQHFVEEIREKPDYARRLAAMAAKLSNQLSLDDVLKMALYARALARDDAFIWRLTEPIVRRAIPEWHWAIASDDWRNSTYDKAIRTSVTSDSTVLEIGTGTGLLAMMAARAGAAHVYTCERDPGLACVARSIIAANGYSDRVTVINSELENVVVGELLPFRCNTLLHEIVSNDLLSENVLALVRYAKESLLEDEPTLLPERIWIMGQLVGDSWPLDLIRLSEHAGFDLSIANLMAPAIGSSNGPSNIAKPLSDPFEVFCFDLKGDAPQPPRSRAIEVPITANGIATSVIQWIGFSFPGEIVFENAPDTRSCWAHRMHPLAPGTDVLLGDTLTLSSEYYADLLTIGP